MVNYDFSLNLIVKFSDKLKVIAKSIFQMEESGPEGGYRALGPHLGGAFVTKRMYG